MDHKELQAPLSIETQIADLCKKRCVCSLHEYLLVASYSKSIFTKVCFTKVCFIIVVMKGAAYAYTFYRKRKRIKELRRRL